MMESTDRQLATRSIDAGWDRRSFLHCVGALGAGLAATGSQAWAGAAVASSTRKLKLGFDNFSVRAFGWKAPKLIDYAASLRVDTLLLSDIEVYESQEETYLRKLKAQAERAGVEVHVGTGSICPTSSSYNEDRWGKATDHLRLLIRLAKALGSPVVRCYQGTRRDRQGDGGIYRHMEETVKVCQAARTEAEDAGVTIAIENHAGDMQAWELASLIEAAGKDYVGATLDAGNATWTLEDPLVNLDILGPYTVTSGIRDSAIWETDQGASVMWANMGDGVVDWQAYVELYRRRCPNAPFVLEILSYTWQRDLPYLDPSMWNEFPKARAHEFARFVALAKQGRKFVIPEGRPKGDNSATLTQAQQKFDLEASLRYCREVLGLGVRT